MAKDLTEAYRTILGDHFSPGMEISFIDGDKRRTLVYQKVGFDIDGEVKGLRYGENPGQEAALYKLVNGNLTLGEVTTIEPGRYLVSDPELMQFGKHPGKINLTDADNALNILRYLTKKPCVAIMKHNNPSGVAQAGTLAEAYVKADLADRVAAYGGAIALNRPVDKDCAQEIVKRYAEVVVAPDFEEGVVDILKRKPSLRIMRIANMQRLQSFSKETFLDFKALIDGGLIVQNSFIPRPQTTDGFTLAKVVFEGRTYEVKREPTQEELDDLLFGWMVEAGVTSNSVLYVKGGVTVGIGTGEQDRVGVAQIARDKAYRKMADRVSFEQFGKPYNLLEDKDAMDDINRQVVRARGGLLGAAMVSDAFFPFRDGIDVGLAEGVTSVVQPGGSIRDHEVIEACNQAGATMVFTGQRSFKH